MTTQNHGSFHPSQDLFCPSLRARGLSKRSLRILSISLPVLCLTVVGCGSDNEGSKAGTASGTQVPTMSTPNTMGPGGTPTNPGGGNMGTPTNNANNNQTTPGTNNGGNNGGGNNGGGNQGGNNANMVDTSKDPDDTNTVDNLVCHNLYCRTQPTPLPPNIDTIAAWDPCEGGPFSYFFSYDIESGGAPPASDAIEFIDPSSNQIVGKFGGVHLNRRGKANGPVNVRLFTNATVPSKGIIGLRAMCPGTTANLKCSGLSCGTRVNPVPDNVMDHVDWDPCAGKWFNYTVTQNFSIGDQLWVDGVMYDGPINAGTGFARGEVKVELRTDATMPSAGPASITAVCMEQAPTMNNWSPTQVTEYLQALEAFYTDGSGRNLLTAYQSWLNSEIAGIRSGATGSGVALLGFNRAMLTVYGNFLKKLGATKAVRGIRPLPIDPNAALPPTLMDAKNNLMKASKNAEYMPRLSNTFAMEGNNALVGIPTWLQNQGAPAGNNPRWGTARMMGDKSYTNLKDIKSADELGRLIGAQIDAGKGLESYFESGPKKIGGTMAGFSSPPADPAYFGWAMHIDNIFQTWMTKTTEGELWAAKNANHPLLNPERLGSLSGWIAASFPQG